MTILALFVPRALERRANDVEDGSARAGGNQGNAPNLCGSRPREADCGQRPNDQSSAIEGTSHEPLLRLLLNIARPKEWRDETLVSGRRKSTGPDRGDHRRLGRLCPKADFRVSSACRAPIPDTDKVSCEKQPVTTRSRKW